MEKMHLILACCEQSLEKLSLPFAVLPVYKHHSFFPFDVRKTQNQFQIYLPLTSQGCNEILLACAA